MIWMALIVLFGMQQSIHGEQQLSGQELYNRSCNEAAFHQLNREIMAMERDGTCPCYQAYIQKGRCALALAVDAFYRNEHDAACQWISHYWDALAHKAKRENIFGVPFLQKDELINGKSVCVIAGLASDGFGDVLTYQAWISMLKKCGAQHVMLYLHGKQSRLLELFNEQQTQTNLGIDSIVTGNDVDDIPQCDLYIPLCNIPAHVNAHGCGFTTPNLVPLYGLPSLFADQMIYIAWCNFLDKYKMPCSFNHRASANSTLGGIAAMEGRSMPAQLFVQALALYDIATVCYLGGEDHAPIRESIFANRGTSERYAKRDQLDVVPDDYYVVYAQYNQETSTIEVTADEDSGAPSAKVIFIIRGYKPFANALAAHCACAQQGGITATVGTFSEAFAWTGDETYLLLRKGNNRPWRWGTTQGADGLIGRSCWMDAIRIIAQTPDEDDVDGIFERLHAVIKEKSCAKG